MSKAKFTKGPWFHDSRGGIGNSIGAVTGKWEFGDYVCSIATFQAAMPYGSNPRYADELENKMANGYLIAAAPEMYEEIEADINDLDHELGNKDLDPVARSKLQHKRNHKAQLLAKARGE